MHGSVPVSSSRRVVATTEAPAAIGPYSQAIVHGDMVFCSGQIALVPETGELVAGDVAAETRQVLSNLGAVLVAAGAGWGDVVKTTIYLTAMNDFATVNQLYGQVFADAPPARETVAVAELPKGARVEISAMARVSPGGEQR